MEDHWLEKKYKLLTALGLKFDPSPIVFVVIFVNSKYANTTSLQNIPYIWAKFKHISMYAIKQEHNPYIFAVAGSVSFYLKCTKQYIFSSQLIQSIIWMIW